MTLFAKMLWGFRIITVVIAILLIYTSYNLYKNPEQPPPAYFPALLSVCMVSVIILIVCSVAHTKNKNKES
ncbi:hypothetical protein BM86_34120 [Bacillus thuringiensis]|uniref:Uncharacterized protein n=1 Tax=Bacillus thuringiensis TaxID=1428 RepID=A0A9W3S6I6_BACTU|nr:hypothetical protein [Bacillus thuringiensis]ANS45935.1 hypothetical protein BT246_04970 [Bacillus thuringiensis]MBH0340339.1 hypothetical protein [Bacillus thuringiensis]